MLPIDASIRDPGSLQSSGRDENGFVRTGRFSAVRRERQRENPNLLLNLFDFGGHVWNERQAEGVILARQYPNGLVRSRLLGLPLGFLRFVAGVTLLANARRKDVDRRFFGGVSSACNESR
jgi:hypothetical protein